MQSPYTVIALPAGHSSDAVDSALERWWSGLPPAPQDAHQLDWLCLARCQISALYMTRWLMIPLEQWRARFGRKHCNAVLLYSTDYVRREVRVYGLLVLRALSPTTLAARDQLCQRHYLRSEELSCAELLSAPPLLMPTLETVHSVARGSLAQCALEPQREQELCSYALRTLVELSRDFSVADAVAALRRSQPIEELRSAEGQLRSAKARFYAKLALLGMPHGAEQQRAERAWHAWTAATIRLLCPTERHVEDAVRRFHLPFEVRRIGVDMARPDALTYNYLPMRPSSAESMVRFCVLSKSSHRAMMGARGIGTPHTLNAQGKLLPLCVDAAGGRLRRVDPLAPMLYDQELPVCFHCMLVGGESEDVPARVRLLLHSLLYALEADALVRLDPGSTALTMVAETMADGTLFWGIHELVFANGHQLREFASQWAARNSLQLATPAHGPPASVDFACHLQCGTYEDRVPAAIATPLCALLGTPVVPLQRLALRAQAQRESDDGKRGPVATLALLPYGSEMPILPWALAEWVADRMLVDLAAARHAVSSEYSGDVRRFVQDALGPQLLDVFNGVALALGTPLLARLRELSRPAVVVSSLVGGTDLQHSHEYRELEDRLAEGNGARIQEMFRSAVDAGARISFSKEAIVANGKLYLNYAGQFKLRWHDFGSGSGKGRGLLTFVMYARKCSAQTAYQWLCEWEASHPVGALSSAPHADAPPPPGEQRESTHTFHEHKDLLWRHLRRMVHPEEDTASCRYLRETRGLADAPRTLIERNPALRHAPSMMCPDGTYRQALVCTTVCGAALQRIMLDVGADGRVQKTTALESAKRTMGTLVLAPQAKDAVCVQRSEHSKLCVVCEGVETALSVACALGDTCSVFATLGVQNIEHFVNAVCMRDNGALQLDADARNVVWCRENDPPSDVPVLVERRAKTERDTRRGLTAHFERVAEVRPPPEYKDFNDIHMRHPGSEGSALIRACFAPLSMWANQQSK